MSPLPTSRIWPALQSGCRGPADAHEFSNIFFDNAILRIGPVLPFILSHRFGSLPHMADIPHQKATVDRGSNVTFQCCIDISLNAPFRGHLRIPPKNANVASASNVPGTVCDQHTLSCPDCRGLSSSLTSKNLIAADSSTCSRPALLSVAGRTQQHMTPARCQTASFMKNSVLVVSRELKRRLTRRLWSPGEP